MRGKPAVKLYARCSVVLTSTLAFVALLALAAAPALAQNSANPPAGELPGEPPPHPTRVTINGNSMAARVTAIVPPAYPKVLQDTHVSGTVILRAVIEKDGSVQTLAPLSGPQQLYRVAMDAVKQWRYQPTVVEGVPVEVSTTISINFTPGHSPRYEQQGAAMPQTAEAMDPQLRTDILRLIAATHLKETMRDYGRQMMETMRPSIEDSLPETANRKQIMSEVERKMMAALQSDAATDQVIMVYARYLSDEDVKGAAAFYESPAGQRFNSVSTQMEDDLSQSGEQFAMQNLDLILKGLCATHPELRGKADFCQQDSHQHSAFEQPHPSTAQAPTSATSGN
ncbi:MAG: TonB family protein [Candidatus Acidiferrales bacterium]